MTTLLVTGYKSSDLGIFSEKDPKLKVIKKALRKAILNYLEQGVSWFILTGQLGTDYWALEELEALKKTYDFQVATIFCFKDHGQKWQSANQSKLQTFKSVDYVNYCFDHYENPGQLRAYQEFLIDHTDQAYLFYDREHPTNLSHLLEKMRENKEYPVSFLTFDTLNDMAMESDDFG